jgi:two-component system response regulator
VEDNPDDVELSLKAFKKYNLVNEITVARDGEGALKILLNFKKGVQREKRPGLVLLDLKLPRVDGLEVLHQIKNHPRTQPIPVVIITFSKEEDDLIKSYQLGVNSYIRKPVNFDKFVEVVKQLSLYWLILNEPLPKEKR